MPRKPSSNFLRMEWFFPQTITSLRRLGAALTRSKVGTGRRSFPFKAWSAATRRVCGMRCDAANRSPGNAFFLARRVGIRGSRRSSPRLGTIAGAS
ncbi:protein of unknown function (plasmid) [Azospirillum baldaniorum]|uniref:Uncharacterized protein n=1 Tax=Azospirillum baldaniorum TaxID=1064539 RepID=A0A9P1NQF7_9PROT|nr:protein of unknown function [Azospirillum baldaniorum]